MRPYDKAKHDKPHDAASRRRQAANEQLAIEDE
jgi:hypothetical protein